MIFFVIAKLLQNSMSCLSVIPSFEEMGFTQLIFLLLLSNPSVCRSVGHTLLDDEFMYLTYSSSDEVTLGRSDLQKETNHRVSNNANR